MNDLAAELEARVAERVKNMSDAEVEARIEYERAEAARATAKIWMAGWNPPDGYYPKEKQPAWVRDPDGWHSGELRLHTRDCPHVHANPAKPYIYPRLATEEELKTQPKCKVCG